MKIPIIQMLVTTLTLQLVVVYGEPELRRIPRPEASFVAETADGSEERDLGKQKSGTDEEFAINWQIISQAKSSEVEKIKLGFARLKAVPNIRERLQEIVRVAPDEPKGQQLERITVMRTLAKTRSRLAVEFLIEQLNNCETPPDPGYSPSRDHGPSLPPCMWAGKFLNGMALPNAPFKEFYMPKPNEMPQFKAKWLEWYEKNKDKLE